MNKALVTFFISTIFFQYSLAMNESGNQKELSKAQKELVAKAFKSIFNIEHHLLGDSYKEKFAACITAINEMVQADIDINIRSKSGITLLHHAAGKGEVVLVNKLVEKYNANILTQTAHGDTPAQCAFRNRKLDGPIWTDEKTGKEFNGILYVYTFLKKKEWEIYEKKWKKNLENQKQQKKDQPSKNCSEELKQECILF